MNKGTIVLLTAGLLVGGGYALLDNNSHTQSQPSNTSEMSEQASLTRYKPYSSELAATASEEQKVVLFFHASWCPTCQVAERNFTQSHDQIPEDVLILKADYDSETELKKKYDVNYQHTFVQIDAEGNQITQWNGGDISQIKTRVQ